MTVPKVISIPDLQATVGHELGVSRWFQMDQSRINTFAETTEDMQFIHTEPDKAKLTPFGGTIAHGFLTLGMLSAMAEEALPVPDKLTHSVNYGFNRVRFVSPVPVDARVRGRFILKDLEVGDGQVTLTLTTTIEIKGGAKPALVAEWINRHYFT